MGNRQSVSTIEFVNKSDCAKVEITVGTVSRFVHHMNIVKFEITEASPSSVRGFDKNGKLIHEVRFNISKVASSQLWKITNSGVKHKRSPFFTETYSWTHSSFNSSQAQKSK